MNRLDHPRDTSPRSGDLVGRPAAPDDPFDGNHLLNGIVLTAVVSLALVVAPAPVALPVLVGLAFACGRLGGRDGGLGSVVAGSLMFGYAITEPHFVWEIESGHDIALLVALFVASTAASELGVRLRIRARRARARTRPG